MSLFGIGIARCNGRKHGNTAIAYDSDSAVKKKVRLAELNEVNMQCDDELNLQRSACCRCRCRAEGSHEDCVKLFIGK